MSIGQQEKNYSFAERKLVFGKKTYQKILELNIEESITMNTRFTENFKN